jgi:CRP/FNR family nitrogen fixation transcriptional regulator
MSASTQTIDPGLNIAATFPAMGFPSVPAALPAQRHILDSLEQKAITLHAARDEEIVAQDDPALYCYRIMSGCVRTVQLMEDGRRQVGEFLFAGDLFGWEALDTHDFSAEAVGSVTLRRYARRDLEILADQNREAARWLRELTAKRLRSGRDHLVLLGRKTASERIASFLLEMAKRTNLNDATLMALPMNRADMGDYLGLTIETVCRQLTQLRQEGTIVVKNGMIAIRDRRALGANDRRRMMH